METSFLFCKMSGQCYIYHSILLVSCITSFLDRAFFLFGERRFRGYDSDMSRQISVGGSCSTGKKSESVLIVVESLGER